MSPLRSLLVVLVLTALAPVAARADAIPDDSCHSWEHWQGGHDGGCRFGPSCSVTAPGGRADVPLVLGALGLGVLARRGARCPRRAGRPRG